MGVPSVASWPVKLRPVRQGKISHVFCFLRLKAGFHLMKNSGQGTSGFI